MIPILVGMIVAALFGVFAAAVYGAGALTEYPWVDMVLCGLIATGALVTLVSREGVRLRCIACYLSKWMPRLDPLCNQAAPCGQSRV